MANNQINNEYVKKGYLKAYLANRGIRTVDYDEWEHLCDCIDDAKAADVVEVVRCKDCKNWDTSWTPTAYHYEGGHYCAMVDLITARMFYCGHGERRTDD